MEALMRGKESWTEHPVYSEYYSHGREPSQLMLKKGDYKLIYTTDTESGEWETYFYNTRKDPCEPVKIDSSRKEVVVY